MLVLLWTPLPIFFEIVVIRAWPLCTWSFRIFWTFFPFEAVGDVTTKFFSRSGDSVLAELSSGVNIDESTEIDGCF